MGPPTLANLLAWDTETWPRTPEVPIPPLVCATEARRAGHPDPEVSIYLRAGLGTVDAVARFRELITNPDLHIGGTNLSFDLAGMASADPGCLPDILAALTEGRLHSTDTLEALHDNARGCIYVEPGVGPFGRYSQQLLEARYLGINRDDEKHGADAWRKRYHELDGVPLCEWPQGAIDYPLADARNAWKILAIQLGLTGASRHNLQCEADEMRAAFALALSSLYGTRTDPDMTASAVAAMHSEHERSRRLYFEAGIVRVRTANRDETPDNISAEWVRSAGERLAAGEPASWKTRRLADLSTAERALARGRGLRWALDTGRLAELVSAAYLGAPPATPSGRVSTSRDTLVESGDDLLEAFGEAGPNEKLLSTYADVLLQGTTSPIHPSTNSLVASGRTSYAKPNLTNLPRSGAVRYSFVPRPGWVYISVDYAGVELCTLAQVMYTWFGASAMRDAINAGQDLHLRLAARLAGGISYEEAAVRLQNKDRLIKNLRQASKPINFGLPGLMGPAKLVLTARKQGVRFCELSGRHEGRKCAEHPRVTVFRRRTVPPTCTACLALAIEYSQAWRAEWPEVGQYLALTPALAETGRPVKSFGNGMLRLDPSAGAISNHFFQNLAAQGAKKALWLLTAECLDDTTSVLYNNFRPVVFVHDEIIAEVREEALHACATRQAEVMIGTMREYTPDVLIRAEPAAARRWFKGMEATHNKSGRLRPWWPKDAQRPGDTKLIEGVNEWTWEPDQDMMRADMLA